MQNSYVVLLLDASEGDRGELVNALGGGDIRWLHASDCHQAWSEVQEVNQLDCLIAVVAEPHIEDLKELRDHLLRRIGFFPTVFSAPPALQDRLPPLTNWDRVLDHPLDLEVLRPWFNVLLANQEAVRAAQGGTEGGARYDGGQVVMPEPAANGAGKDGELPETLLPIGLKLGDYKLIRAVQSTDDFAIYEAEQTSMGRRVALKILFRKHRKDIGWVQAFVDEASARASVNHPSVSLVYECDQERGVNFYTLELVDAPTLDSLLRKRTTLSDASLRRILTTCADVLAYFQAQGMTHRVLDAQNIFWLKGEVPRIANPVKNLGASMKGEEQVKQLSLLGTLLKSLADPSTTNPSTLQLLDRLGRQGDSGITSVAELRAVLVPSTASDHIPLQSAAPALGAQQASDRSRLIKGGAVGMALLLVVGLSLALFSKKMEVRDRSMMVMIPAGAFPYQGGDALMLPDYWIGQYEVSIADYALFLEALEGDPDLVMRVRHPEQPPQKTGYVPDRWAELYMAARRGGQFLGSDVDLNCPVVGVDWWDAHAYSSWRGGRLPTEQEWEKAALGHSGKPFPWGDEEDLSRFNSGVDYQATETAEAGSVDGYKYWSPVDALPSDESRYGVIGMAGNVSEWTASNEALPEAPDRRVQIKRGASFATKSDFALVSRRPAETRDERNFWTGIRIAADTPLDESRP